VLESATRIDFSLKAGVVWTSPIDNNWAIDVRGGQGGAGAGDVGGGFQSVNGQKETAPSQDACLPGYPTSGLNACRGHVEGAGGDGGPGIIQLHTPNGIVGTAGSGADIVLGASVTIDRVCASLPLCSDNTGFDADLPHAADGGTRARDCSSSTRPTATATACPIATRSSSILRSTPTATDPSTRCEPALAYCSTSTTSSGCSPLMAWLGTPSASAASGFVITVAGVDGQRAGTIFYGLGATALPWHSGTTSTLCVAPPSQRTACKSAVAPSVSATDSCSSTGTRGAPRASQCLGQSVRSRRNALFADLVARRREPRRQPVETRCSSRSRLDSAELRSAGIDLDFSDPARVGRAGSLESSMSSARALPIVSVLLLALVARAQSTVRYSVDWHGAQIAGTTARACGSLADGRWLFFCAGDAVVPGDANGLTDVFARERVTGAITMISVKTSGAQANGSSDTARSSFDGQVVAFTSEANDFVPGDANLANDVYVRDRQAGSTVRASVANSGAGGKLPQLPRRDLRRRALRGLHELGRQPDRERPQRPRRRRLRPRPAHRHHRVRQRHAQRRQRRFPELVFVDLRRRPLRRLRKLGRRYWCRATRTR
jgi:hypothetical protein